MDDDKPEIMPDDLLPEEPLDMDDDSDDVPALI